MASPPNNPPIFHITHGKNLGGILHEGRLWSDNKRIERGFPVTNIGYSHIKDRRRRRPVQAAMGGVLGDYVPFNFCSRSVMLYVLSQGHQDYSGGQRPIVHLVSSVETVIATGRPWAFSDIHAELTYARHFDDLDRLNEVDWSVMPLQWWNDPRTKEKRQAEFLVYDYFPWTAIERIVVCEEAVRAAVLRLLVQAEHQPPVEVRPEWYY